MLTNVDVQISLQAIKKYSHKMKLPLPSDTDHKKWIEGTIAQSIAIISL
ncbi:hypothetical protein RCH20_002163 [Psychrobacter sp. PL15]|nr:hypothetical protein [Psychrobacter sp. PL15]